MAYLGASPQLSLQNYLNIDDISGSFNGSTTSFALLVNGVFPVPGPKQSNQLLISVNGVIQEPDDTGAVGFRLSGTNIVFSSAPTSGQSFFGVVLAGADYVYAGTNFPDGTLSAPSITFASDLDTGFTRSATGEVKFTSNGSESVVFGSNSLTAKSFVPTSSTVPTNGVYLPSANNVAISTNGTGRLFVDSSGNVGVGASGSYPLDVSRGAGNGISARFRNAGGSAGYVYNSGTDVVYFTGDTSVNNAIGFNSTSNYVALFSGNGTERLRITSAGLVGVGTSSPGAKIHSVETSAAEGLRVDGASGGFALVVNGGTGRETRIKQASIGNTFVSSTPPADGLIVQGSVGVGTTSPNANSQLHIAGSSYQPLYVNTTASDGGGAAFLRSGTQALYVGTAGGNWLTGSSTADGLIRSEANLIFATGGNTQRAQIDSSGRLLVGTTSSTAASRFIVQGNVSGGNYASMAVAYNSNASAVALNTTLGEIDFTDQSAGGVFARIRCAGDAAGGTNDYPGRLEFHTTADGASSPTERLRIANDGAISSVIPGGSTLYPRFGCRAWINFDGTSGSIGTGRASGNVTSVTDNGLGDYTVNFSTSMPDANYAVLTTTGTNLGTRQTCVVTSTATSNARIYSYNDSGSNQDSSYIGLAIFR